jgi:cytochrome P450
MSYDTDATDLAKVDLTDLDLWRDGPPHELFARMRSEAPVHRNPTADGPQFWSLTRGQDITTVSQDTETFSSARGGIFLQPDALAPLDFARHFVIFKDPPEHSRYRDIVAKAFLPRNMHRLDEIIHDIVTGTLDTLAERGEVDLVTDVAVPIPLKVLGRLLGAPDEDTDQLLGWSDEIEAGITHGRDVSESLQRMGTHLGKLVDEQVVHGVDSLAMSLANAEVEGEHLSEAEIATYFGMLLYGGLGPIRNAISAGMLALLQHPDQLALLRESPNKLRSSRSGLAPIALEEILRWSSPVNYFARTATTDTTINGIDIKTDDRVVMWYVSANRDPDAFADPDTFNVNRGTRELAHYAFGGGGPHRCQGSFLAIKTLSVALTEIIQRLPGIEQAGDITREPSAFIDQLTSLPVTFSSSS